MLPVRCEVLGMKESPRAAGSGIPALSSVGRGQDDAVTSNCPAMLPVGSKPDGLKKDRIAAGLRSGLASNPFPNGAQPNGALILSFPIEEDRGLRGGHRRQNEAFLDRAIGLAF